MMPRDYLHVHATVLVLSTLASCIDVTDSCENNTWSIYHKKSLVVFTFLC